MKISFNKNNIIQILLLLVILLLSVNIILEKFYGSATQAESKTIQSSLINERFLKALNDYNIDSSWILRNKVDGGKRDSLKFYYKVSVPQDLPISLLIREIQNQFDTSEADIESIEYRKSNSTELSITSGGYQKLKAIMSTSDEIKRKTDSISFVLTGVSDLSNENFSTLLLLPEHFAGVLLPSKKSQELMRILQENQKEVAIMLNDDITELEFKLKTGYSAGRIRNSVLSIIGKFNKAAFFLIDENSDIYNSMHFKKINEEFLKRNIILLKWGRFNELKIESKDKLISDIRGTQKNNKIFKLSASDFLEMPPFLAALRKTGYKFVSPSVLIKHQDDL